MWLFTQHGMVSIVAHRTEPGMLLVRSRTKSHLEQLLQPLTFSDYFVPKIERTPEGDYEYRVCVPKGAVAIMIADAIGEVDYPNFKGRCDALARDSDSGDYAGMLHSIWSVVHRALAKNVSKVGRGRRTNGEGQLALERHQPEVEDFFDRYRR